MEPVHRPLVVVDHTPPLVSEMNAVVFSPPPPSRSQKRHHMALNTPTLLPLAHTRGARPPIARTKDTWSPVAQASGASPTVACARGTLPSETLYVLRERYSYGGLPLLLSPSQQWQLASPMGPDLLRGFLSYGVLLPGPWCNAP